MGLRHTEQASSFDSGNRVQANRSEWQENVTATITGYACDCTPYTDHPGTGEKHRSSGMNRGPAIAERGSISNFGAGERVGPWREHHLDSWTPPDTRPAVILDPFSGTATVAGVAKALGRIGIGIDLSGDYGRLGKWRVEQSGHFNKAIGRTWKERQETLL
jgi:hypothetical protein